MKTYTSLLLILFLTLFSGRVAGQPCTITRTITGPASACAGSTGNVYTTESGMTEYSWSVSEGGSITSGSGTNEITVTWSSAGAKTVSVNYKDTDNCTESSPAVKDVTVNALPVPTITGSASVCEGTTGVTYTTESGMSDYSWNISAGGTITDGSGTNVITVTWNSAGAQTVSVNYKNANNCTASDPTIKDVTVNPVLAVSVSIVASANPVCAGTSVTFTATPVNGGTPTYQWYKNSNPAGTNSSTYADTPVNGDQVYVIMTSIETCKSGSPAISNTIILTVKAEPAITGQPSSQIRCPGVSVSFSVTATGDGLTYQWKKGGSDISGATFDTYTITNPAETDEGSYTVVVTGDCGTETSASATLTVRTPTGTPVFTDGDTLLCNSVNETYVATTTYGTISYSISPSGAGTINSGTGYVNWDNNFDGTAVITATATGECSIETATRSVRVYDTAPTRPSSITGLTSVCRGQTDVIYSPVPVSSATYYYWEVTSGITILDGQGTSSLKVSFASDASSPQTVSVKSGNPCGLSGTFRNLSVEVRPIPTASITPSTTTVCQGAASPQVTINNLTSRAVIVTYNINGADQTEAPVDASNHIHIDVGTSSPGTFTYTLVSVRYQTEASCSNLISGTATVVVTPTVGTPTPITVSEGSDPTCQLTNGTTTTTYATTATNNTGFNWSLSNPAAGSIGPTTGIMTWANDFSGSVNIQVSAEGCNGPTAPLVTRTVTVTPTVGIPSAITVSSGTEPTCQLDDGTTTTTYLTSATNSTGFNWSLSNSAAGSINPTTGIMTWANGFSGTVDIRVTANGCNGPSAQTSRTVNITPHVGTPTPVTVSAGTQPSCQLTNGTTTTTYSTTATNSTGFNWSVSNPAAGSIDPASGVMTWADGFYGSVDIQVTATGCNSTSSMVTRTVSITQTVGTPAAISITGGSDPSCQLTNGSTMTLYSTSATNSTGFNWSLSDMSAGSIDPATGVMTWANGFSGSVNIQVTATGCNGPSAQVIRTVNVTPTVGTPTGITVSLGSEPACQLDNGTTTTTYATTATNSTGFNWSLSSGTAGSINPTTGEMTWADGFAGSVDIRVTANGCNGPSSQVPRTVNITPFVGTPTAITVSAGSQPTCQLTDGTTTTTYSTTATNSTGFNWSLSDISAGSIDPATGVMTWANGFSGTVNIQVTANGCNSISSQVIRTVNITPAPGTPTPITIAGGSDPACQLTSGTTMTFYSTTSTNSTGFNWSVSDPASGTINASSGLMTWANNYSGTVDIQVTASGCGTSPMVKRTVTVNPLPVVTITGPAAPRITSTVNVYETQAGMTAYTWSVSGGGSGTSTSSTITVAWNTTGNQTVSVNYIDAHGCTATSPTIYNVVVKPLPSASNALISGYPAVGNTLTGTYTYTDGSSGTDNSTYRWLRNGTDPISLATGTNYIPTADDINKTLTFEVTPVSSVGPPTTGSAITSSPTELVEDLSGVPVADEVCIEGIRAEGNIIRGEYRYTFSKAEGVSTYRWLRRDTATDIDVVIGTNIQYTLVAADIDDTKDIIFEVTPVSSNLTPIPGAPVQSNPLARILIPKTEYSVSEADVTLSANEPGGVFSGTGVTGNIFSPSSAGSAGSPYTLTYLLNIVNTSSSCSQQASKIITVNPNVTSFVGLDPFYCHDGGPDTITVSGVPSDATDRDFTLTDSDGIIAESGTSVTIDPGKMRPGVNKDILYFSYKRLGIFYRISKSLVIDSVGTEMRIINLDTAYCQGDARKYISVEGVYPSGGTADWSGVILSDTKPASAYADPSLGTPGLRYPVSYIYKSPTGCYSATLSSSVKINPLPDPTFSLNPTYNIDGGRVVLTPVQSGGIFSGRGVSGDVLFPGIAGLGEDEITYSITDKNKCSASLALKTTIRTAQGSISGIPSVICYDDTTYNISVTGLPTTGALSITNFTNFKNSLIYTSGSATASYNVPDAGEGLDTLEFSYKWDGVDYSISKAVNVDSLGQVIIKNLSPGAVICDHVAPYELFPSITGGAFTGPVTGGYLYPSKATRSDTVTYTYTNLKTGCTISAIVPITVYPSPKVAFAPADVCIEDDKDTTLFKNSTTSTDAVQSWFWEFTEAGSITTSADSTGAYLYKTGGLQKVALTATTVNNCAVTREQTFDLGKRPEADFYWKNDCMHPNDNIILVDTTYWSSPIISRSWRILGGAEFSTNDKQALYPKTGTGYLSIQYIVRTSYPNCIDTVTKDIFIRPTLPADGYFENFEAGNGGWVKGETEGNNWSFGTPDRTVINSASSGKNAWYTRFNISAPQVESSSIVSPCFDFTTIERPLIKLKLWKRFEKDRDGAALQYKIGDSKEWQYIGTIDDGIEWFNSAVIRGEPGGNSLGWTTIGTPDKTWVESIHTLDNLTGKKDVKFRIAYGSDGFNSPHDGVAFDDIWIGERNRNVLLEHFTNITDTVSSSANSLVNTIVKNRKEDVINIQYHTNFPKADPYYNDNPGDASARILYYGLIKAPYTFIDGGTKKEYANTFVFDAFPAVVDSNDVTRRSLIPSKFGITLSANIYGGILSVNGEITSSENKSYDNLTLFIAVTEKTNSEYTGAAGETEYQNVFRKFIPDAGGINLKKSWTKDEKYTLPEQTWVIEKVKDASDIEVIAFIQSNITKELYQAASEVKQNIAVGIEDLLVNGENDFALYPNPAVNKLTITFAEPLKGDADIRIYNLQGLVISSYRAGTGITEFNIDDLSLKGGIYLVRVTVDGIDYGFRKLLITGS